MIYDNIIKNKNIIKEKQFNVNINFVDGAFVEIVSAPKTDYKVQFFDGDNLFYETTLSPNMWARPSRKYFTNWNIVISKDDEVIYNYIYVVHNKKVYIPLESKSLGDTLAWLPYVDEFRKHHNCKVVTSTFMNELFIDQYPEIEFVNPGEIVHNLYAMYKIGWFYDGDKVNYNMNPNDFKLQPLQKTASDILGLKFEEVQPKLKVLNEQKLKRVGIGIHSTAQSKYWNNPNGWQEVVNHLKEKGYEVVLYSKENDGYMGNKHPKGITKFKGGSIQEVINDMSTCEFFIGLGSGLSWLAWSINLPVILISGFSEEWAETTLNTYRVINKSVCYGCFNHERLDPGDWNWCPKHKNTERMFECTKTITSQMVINKINIIVN